MAKAEDTGNQAFVTASQEATKLAKNPSNEVKLELYSLFKQGIEGDNETPQPGFMDFVGKAKWAAWSKLKGMSKEEAQEKYIALVESLKANDA